ncbi:hypothetical protein EX30DRAFT_253618 [Ascodesmis nigricans]|uniref:LIM zinc-binding domain-containing protein n=1 Tax=Ascodesmis nigricans TaxID=341454 RepID=A0A4S2MY70_9PEZI|nr:hypothetical protein EX30DRAFT_253618 [Ascodesmis nigricans]
MPTFRRGSKPALPSIKCTICGERTQISQMGDHVCKSTVDLLRTGGDDRFKVSSHPQIKPPTQPHRKNTLPPIDPSVASDPYYYPPDQLTPQSSTRGSSPRTPHDMSGFGSAARSIPRKPLNTTSGTNFTLSIHAPPSPEQSPTGSTGQFGRRTPGLDGSRHQLNNMSSRPFHSGSPPKNTVGHGSTRSPSVGPYCHAVRGQNTEDSQPRKMPEPDYYSPIRPLSTRSSRSQLRSKPSRDWGQHPLPRNPSISSFGQDRSGNYTATMNVADQHRLNRAETEPLPCTDITPPMPIRTPTLSKKHQSTSSGRSPPHTGIGLPRTPSQTVKAHRLNSSTSTSPLNATGEPPMRPLHHAASSSLAGSGSRSHSPMTLGTGMIPPPMSISEAPPPSPPNANVECFSVNIDSSTQNKVRSVSSSSTTYSGSSSGKSGGTSITTPSISEADHLVATRLPKAAERASNSSSPPDRSLSKSRNRNRHGSKRSYSIWEIEDLTRSLLLAQEENNVPTMPPVPSENPVPRPDSQASTMTTASRATSRAPSRTGHKRSATSKGICRGCSQPIYGKSISSADGRLTGRWHKACFVCTTCKDPFSSIEFYVLDNLPYCGRHYHELNFTLCPTCDMGIEGPCLETEDRRRFHPNCFACSTCHEIIAGTVDYYEVDGKPLCERHGRSLIQQQQQYQQTYVGTRRPSNLGPGLMPPSSKVERRRTRLMFMDPNAPNGGNATEGSTVENHLNIEIPVPDYPDTSCSSYDRLNGRNTPSKSNLRNLSVNAKSHSAYSPSVYPEAPSSPLPPPPIEKSPRHMNGEWQQPQRPPQQPLRQIHVQQAREPYSTARMAGPRMETGRIGLPSNPRMGLRTDVGGMGMSNPMMRRPVNYYD